MLLALYPIRLKNYADLEIGRTFKEADGSWWIALPSVSTKTRRWPDERALSIIETFAREGKPTAEGQKWQQVIRDRLATLPP